MEEVVVEEKERRCLQPRGARVRRLLVPTRARRRDRHDALRTAEG